MPIHKDTCSKINRFFLDLVLCIFFIFLLFIGHTQANHVIRYGKNPSYDDLPITPKTWKEVDLVYSSIIKGKRYTNSIQLLRPIIWIKNHHMDKVGNHVHLSMPEFGIISVTVSVVKIKPNHFDSRKFDWSKSSQRPVIGRFTHYVTDARTYDFINSTGNISHIISTPNHPFYIKNYNGHYGAFVPIESVGSNDYLVGEKNRTVHLICNKGKHSHCSKKSFKNTIITYNIEVYKNHVYKVGHDELIVHNGCYSDLKSKIASLSDEVRAEIFSLENKTLIADDHIRIYSSSKINSSKFISVFRNKEWIIKDIARDPASLYYANQALEYQYILAHEASNFTQHPLKNITLFSVKNIPTIQALENIKPYTSLFKQKFLSAPLGKMTQRITSDMGLDIEKVGWENGDIKIFTRARTSCLIQ